MDEIISSSSAAALARAIRDKEVSATEVIQAYLKRIEEVNPKLHAVVTLCGERALDAARGADEALAKGEVLGPPHGVPMTLKDSLDTAGVLSTGGVCRRWPVRGERTWHWRLPSTSRPRWVAGSGHRSKPLPHGI